MDKETNKDILFYFRLTRIIEDPKIFQKGGGVHIKK